MLRTCLPTDSAAFCRSGRDDIERAYLQERKAHLEQCEAEMAQVFERRAALEAEFMERYLAMVESYQKQLFDLQARHNCPSYALGCPKDCWGCKTESGACVCR